MITILRSFISFGFMRLTLQLGDLLYQQLHVFSEKWCKMSRLIVKNLPAGIKEERLRNHFGNVGVITDCSLKYSRSGVFRKFAFVGYKTEAEANAALKQFNKTFIDASKLTIEIAKDFGDANKPRPWSKYSKENSSGQSNSKKTESIKESESHEKKHKKDNKVVEELLDNLKDDSKFNEFLEVHQNVSTKPVWTNDAVKPSNWKEGSSKSNINNNDNDAADDDDESSEDDAMENEGHEKIEIEGKEEQTEGEKSAAVKGLSDFDYLKSKMSGKDELVDSDSDSEEETKKQKKVKQKTKKSPEDSKETKVQKKRIYMLKLKGLPTKCGEKAVKEFFHPLSIAKLNVIKNAVKRPVGTAYVGFKTENDLEQALRRNKNFIGGKKIYLKIAEQEQEEVAEPEQPRPWEVTNVEEDTEGVAETGRLFVRNLAYTCTDDDLEAEFKKFGLLTEIKLPVDQLTKKLKGFAFITYMIPEHAVKAYSELDGKVFQGRMLHIMPAREMKDDTEENTEGSSYKKQKSAKQKKMASSSHNWNSLFLGSNAVVDVLAEKYQAEKSDILDTNMKGSLGVRLALGETQVVQETRDFLTEQGVSLDSFSQAKAPRSKTVILVKNLPARTDVSEIENLFSPYGTLGRVLLPPSGISAIVEFLIPTEAKAAFTKLAYRKFHHVPLYLEWAPMEVFSSPPPVESKIQKTSDDTKEEKMDTGDDAKSPTQKSADNQKSQKADDDDDDDAVGSVLFVKNLNFDTSDESLKEHFGQCKSFKSANVATKKDLKRPGQTLSMGYGFVEFRSPDGAKETMKTLQHTSLDGHTLELKISNRTTTSMNTETSSRNKQKEKKQVTTKIMVKNIPFEAKQHEVAELFKVFGELKTVRLPKKLGVPGSHRGFGFVDFLTKQDAKRAFEALCHSTHLYGRRLVLEWADSAEDVDAIRKRTAEQFHDTSEYGGKKLKKSGLMESLDMSVPE